jgi:hypothetical protein
MLTEKSAEFIHRTFFVVRNIVIYSKNVSPCISHIKVTRHVFVLQDRIKCMLHEANML